MLYHIAYIIWRVLIAPILGVKVFGRENIPKTGPFIIAANHMSVFDPCLVIIAARLGMRPIRWCAGLSLFAIETAAESLAPDKHPIIAWLVGFFISRITKHSFAIPVEREEDSLVAKKQHQKYSNVNKHALIKILKTLKSEEGIIGIFPEGGLDRKGLPVYASFIEMAQRSDVPIIPAYIHKWGVMFGTPVTVGKSLTPDEIKQQAKDIMEGIYAMEEAA